MKHMDMPSMPQHMCREHRDSATPRIVSHSRPCLRVKRM